jgi:tRNA pseudouridine55 synthase
MAYFGILNINKPAGVTSRWVVDRVQRLVRPDKVGHAGTLDPLATGVLVVALGQATRLIEYVQQSRKSYRGTFLLGRSSDTEDTDGTVTELPDAPIPQLSELKAAAARMIGEIQQRPPAYSAIKVEGQRAYDLARAGRPVELAPRPVQIHRIEVVAYEYPQLVLDIDCGGGTYVRTVGREMAEACGTASVMSGLVRNAVGEFRIEKAIDVETLSKESIAQALISPLQAVSELATVCVDDAQRKRLSHGLAIPNTLQQKEGEVAAVNAKNQLVAILSVTDQGLRPNRYFAVAEQPDSSGCSTKSA